MEIKNCFGRASISFDRCTYSHPVGLELSDPFTTAEKLGSGQFATALRRIGLADVGRENFTLFAPTDEAFREAGLIQVGQAI